MVVVVVVVGGGGGGGGVLTIITRAVSSAALPTFAMLLQLPLLLRLLLHLLRRVQGFKFLRDPEVQGLVSACIYCSAFIVFQHYTRFSTRVIRCR